MAERSRARNLIDLLGNQRLTLKGAIEQERYDEQKRLTSRIREYEALAAQAKTEAERRTYEKDSQEPPTHTQTSCCESGRKIRNRLL